jgi:ligand-binding sensor domain-containing protein/signal transduction histidine kinase
MSRMEQRRVRATLAGLLLLLVSPCGFGRESAYSRRIHLPIEEGNDLAFVRLPLDNGSTHATVWAITKDRLGFLWFSTSDGLKRFDGYRFRDVRPEAGNPYSLSGREVKPLFNDRSGKLWVASDLSAARYDPLTETFTSFSSNPLVKGPIHHIYQDRAGMIWLTTPIGLVRMDPETGKTRREGEKLTNVLRSILEDKDGTFWVSARESLEVYDRQTGRVTRHIQLRDGDETERFTNISVDLLEDHAGVLWVASERDGLAMVDRMNNRLVYYALSPEDDPNLEPGARAILEDKQGVLWVGTKSGLYRLDRDRTRLVRYRHDYDDPDSLNSDYVSALYEDDEGGMWVGADRGGIVRFSPHPAFRRERARFGEKHDDGADYVASTYQDRQGDIWMGGKGVLNRIDGHTGRTTSYALGGPRGGFANADILGIVEDSAGKVWLATWGGGIHRFDPQTGEWKVYRHKADDTSSLIQDSVFTLFFDRDGRLWAGTENGLDGLDPKTERFEYYRVPELGNNRERSIAQDIHGSLWLATLYTGVHRFDPKTGAFTIYRHSEDPRSLSNDAASSICVDHNGTVWAGTANGLDRFDEATGKFTTYTERDGLGGMSVTGIQEDERGNLWMTTNRGLSRFDPASHTFQNYYRADGIPSDVTSIWKGRQGEMFVGSFNGLIRFSPDHVITTPFAPPVLLTDFELNDLSAGVAANSPLRQSIALTRSLTLSYRERIFGFEFAALSYANPMQTRYRYILENFETNWNDADATQRSVRFTALAPGDYVFRVQARTNRGTWSGNGPSVRIRILPPWWASWQFKLACALSVCLALWAAYRIRVRQMAGRLNLRFEERLQERSRIAGELHDTLLQGFLSASMQLDVAADLVPPDSPARPRLNHILQLMARVTAEGRNALQGLRSRSEDLMRLDQVFAQIQNEFPGGRNEPPVAFRVAVEGRGRPLHPVFRDEVYRIGREAILNAFRHSRAKNIEVLIEYSSSQFRLMIDDDGCGIDPRLIQAGREGHWGLPGMRERSERIGAQFRIWSRSERGTRVELSIPSRLAFQSPKQRSWAASVVDSWRRGLGQAWRNLVWPRIHIEKTVGKDAGER